MNITIVNIAIVNIAIVGPPLWTSLPWKWTSLPWKAPHLSWIGQRVSFARTKGRGSSAQLGQLGDNIEELPQFTQTASHPTYSLESENIALGVVSETRNN